MIPPFVLNHVALPSPEPERSMTFYAAFGFKPGFVRHDSAGRIELQQMQRDGCFVELISSPDVIPGGHFGLHTEDLHAALAHLSTQGITPLHPPRRGQSGVLWTFFRDPAGNLVEVTAP